MFELKLKIEIETIKNVENLLNFVTRASYNAEINKIKLNK